MSILILAFDFSVTQTEPPTSNQVRLNDSLYANVTKIWARNLTTDGVDMRLIMLAVPVGTDVYLQDKNDSTTFARYTVTAPPVDKTSYVEFPVTAVAHSGTSFINNQAVILVLITEPAPVTPPPPSGPDLVAFAVAKDHLHITDSDHDGDIQTKLHQASDSIRKFLKAQADPTWDATTAPAPVQAATLMLLTDLYEFRGDDGNAPADPASRPIVWIRIGEYLAQFRDPALA